MQFRHFWKKEIAVLDLIHIIFRPWNIEFNCQELTISFFVRFSQQRHPTLLIHSILIYLFCLLPYLLVVHDCIRYKYLFVLIKKKKFPIQSV